MPLFSGDKLGPYEILAPIGAGGMGEVYRAKDLKLHREVAIKVLPEGLAQDPARLARFEREAQVLASLNHPNIAQIYGLEDRALVMELVPGETLGSLINPGPLPLETALNYAKQIAEALEGAHEKGIIHRDLKPANVMVTPEGVVKVLDFGLAAVSQGATPVSDDPLHSPTLTLRATQAGMIMGTAAYMSPEQARGSVVDRRADIWAFGVVLLEALTGRSPFQGETVSDTLADVLRGSIDWKSLPPGTPPGVRRLLERCLERDPRQRLRDIGEARILLSDPDLLAPAPPNAYADVRASVTGPWGRPAVWAALALTAVASVVSGFWISGRLRHSSPLGVTRLSIPLPADQVLTGGSPAVSRDGRFIAYGARGADGVSRLYVRALDRFESSEIPNSQGAQLPFFSPDASRIGFFAGGKLLTASREGGSPTAIADASYLPIGATWGEDDAIFYVPALTSGILRIAASGGKPQKLTDPDGGANGYAHVWPQYLFETHSVLFTIWGGQNMEANGTVLLSPRKGTWTRAAPILWSSRYAQSGHLLASGPHGVMAGAFDPAKPQEARTHTFVVDDVFSTPNVTTSWFAVSDTGTLVYVPGDPHLSTLAWVDRAGAVTPIADTPQSMADPALSPDGTRLVVSEDLALWVRDLRRGTKIRLTFDNEGANLSPIWNREGTRIIFGSNRGGDLDLYSVSASGGPAKRLLARKGTQFPMSEAPDGTLLFSERAQGTAADLWTLAPDGTAAPFAVSQASKVGGQFSPDGRMVAYVSDETGRNEVYLRSVARPSDALAVSSNGGAEPQWSPGGKQLFYRNGDTFLAVSVNSAGALAEGDTRKLFEMRAAWGRSTNHAGYSVSPDGRRFLILRPDPRAIPRQINVVLNWFEELKAKVPSR